MATRRKRQVRSARRRARLSESLAELPSATLSIIDRVPWRGEVPTEPLPIQQHQLRRTPYRDPRIRAAAQEHDVRVAMDLALSVGEVLLRCGAGAAQVEASIIAVAMAAGVENLEIDITVQSILLQVTGDSGRVIARLRVVRAPRWDLGRLAMIHRLIDALVSSDITVAEATEEIARINRTPRTWSQWVVTAATGFLAAGVASVLGAGILAMVLCALTSMAVNWLLTRLRRHPIPDFYLNAVGGFVATVLAYAAYVLGFEGWLDLSPSDFAAIVAGGIVALLPARSIAAAIEDVITGYPVTGTARIAAVLMHTLGLIIGVAVALSVSVWAGSALGFAVSPPSVERMASTSAGIISVITGSAVIGLAGAVTMQSQRRFLVPSAALTVLTVLVVGRLTGTLGMGRLTAVALTSIVLGFFGRLIALRFNAPAMVLTIPATLGLLPGLAIFVGLYRLIVKAGSELSSELTVQVGVAALATSLGVLVAMATGSILGDLLAAPLDRRVWQRRAHGFVEEQRP